MILPTQADRINIDEHKPIADLEKRLIFSTEVAWQEESIRRLFREGNGESLAYLAHPNCLFFVSDNIGCLIRRGIYEPALVASYSGSDSNLSNWSLPVLESLFECGDSAKLQACGAPLPAGNPIRIYRGVAGVGRARRARGISWTLDLDVACWFALRYSSFLPDPAVFEAELLPQQVFCRILDRGEDEIIARPSRFRRVRLGNEEMIERHARMDKLMKEGWQRLIHKPKGRNIE